MPTIEKVSEDTARPTIEKVSEDTSRPTIEKYDLSIDIQKKGQPELSDDNQADEEFSGVGMETEVEIPGTPTFIKVLYYPNENRPGLSPYYLLEFSVPKLIYGTNARLIYNDLGGAMQKLNELINTLPGLPEVDVTKGIIHRIDLCYDHVVGNCVGDYLLVLRDLDYSHREPTISYTAADAYSTKGTGVSFRSNTHSTTFYDKQAEMLKHSDTRFLPKAVGILRQEQRINSKRSISKLLKLRAGEQPTLLDFTEKAIVRLLNDDLTMLGLTHQNPTRFDTALETLTQCYGTRKADTLYSFLIRYQKTNRDKLIELYRTIKQSGKDKGQKAKTESVNKKLEGYIRDIWQANVSMCLDNNMQTLNPLEINLEASNRYSEWRWNRED